MSTEYNISIENLVDNGKALLIEKIGLIVRFLERLSTKVTLLITNLSMSSCILGSQSSNGTFLYRAEHNSVHALEGWCMQPKSQIEWLNLLPTAGLLHQSMLPDL